MNVRYLGLGGCLLAVGAGAVWAFRPRPAPHVFLVVLDTVRADHTSLCGYPRPTTPTLERLRAEGAAVACDAVAPGGWTMPSHASYFTGLEVPDHGVWRVAGEDHNPLAAAWPVVPLAPGHQTLATGLRAAGYQTIGLSANPALAEATGLQQGFDRFEVSGSWQGGRRSFRGDRLRPALEAVLDAVDPARPVFLFVNVFDAHDPYPPVPPGVDWAEAQPATKLSGVGPEGAPRRFLDGQMGPDEVPGFLERVGNGYDWGIHEADARLAEVLDVLRARGLLDGDWRLVVTSDHGEYVGEHTLLRHGMFLYEPNQRVPLVYQSSAGAPTLPSPVSALVVHSLARDGRLPAELPPIRAAEAPHHANPRFRVPAVAWWTGAEKRSWLGDGTRERYNLATDPGELTPLPLGEDPPFDGWVDHVRESLGRATATGAPNLDPLLEELGYVE